MWPPMATAGDALGQIAPTKGAMMLAAKLNLGVVPSFCRPRASNDNAYAKSRFRTANDCPNRPEEPFASQGMARSSSPRWAAP